MAFPRRAILEALKRRDRTELSSSRFVRKHAAVTAVIARSAAARLRDPDTFCMVGLSVDESGNGASVWDAGTAKRDSYGWLLYCASLHLKDESASKTDCYAAIDYIAELFDERAGTSLIGFSEDSGPVATARILDTIADTLLAADTS